MTHLSKQPIEVDVLERLPTPWGLVRGGVAPDHPEKKAIADVFDGIARRVGFRFFGNLEVGSAVQPAELAQWYDAVLYAHGAASDRRLAIPGEALPGSASAREFVAWYNGHPDASALNFDLSCTRAVIVGNGNVALDVARMLTASPDRLAKTDIADGALAALRASGIREVVILGRRGPLQAAFNNPELEELAELEGVDVIVDPCELPSREVAIASGASWTALRKLDTLRRYASRPPTGQSRRIVLSFLESPIALLGQDRLTSMRIARNALIPDAAGQLQAQPTGETRDLEAGLVLRAVGYASVALPGLPFDARRCLIPNDDGRVLDGDARLPGVYVTGWAKRGPSGIIGSNRKCARDTVRALLDDLASDRIGRSAAFGRDEVSALLRSRQPKLVEYQGWKAIDEAERHAGQAAGRPRVKLTSMPALLAASGLATTTTTPFDAPRRAPKIDAIVVGSGLGGLSTAACLAASGKAVMVLEQHEIVGGCSQTFRRKGIWEFDCGVHYVGDCVPGSNGLIPTVLRGLGVEDRIAWSRLDDSGMDTVQFPEHQFRVPTSWDGLTANLRQCFPQDADGLAKCIAELRYIGEGADRINDTPHSISVLLPLFKRPLEALAIARGLEFPIGHLFDRCGLSLEARASLLALVHLHNTPPKRTPALLVAILLRHYFKAGAYFPTQGGQVLAANLVEVIRAHGGVVRTKTRVQSIDIEAGRVQGVTLTTGERLRADVVVSNADVHRTFQDLIEPRHLSRRTLARIGRFRRPHSIFSMYLGADIDLSRTRPATNYILHGRYDVQTTYDLMDRGQWDPKAWIAISSPTLKTGGVRHYGPSGYSSIELFTPVPGEYSFWGGGDPMAGTGYKWSSVYRERKAEIEGLLLERTLVALPELRGHIAWQESATPLTHERFTLSRMPYGPENAKDQIGPYRRLPVTTEIAGLFLAGASTAYMYGIAFTLRGGVGTASHILGRDLLRDFQAGQVIADRSALPEHGPDWDPFHACRGFSKRGPIDEQALQSVA